MDFLLPDSNYNDLPPEGIDGHTQFCLDVLSEWMKDDNPSIKVRMGTNIIQMLLGESSCLAGFGTGAEKALPIVTIANNGDIGPLDELRNAVPEFFVKNNIFNTSYSEFIDSPEIKEMYNQHNTLPVECEGCCWKKICQGGPAVSRFGKDKTFNHPSIYCDTFKEMYKKITSYMISQGASIDEIKQCLAL